MFSSFRWSLVFVFFCTSVAHAGMAECDKLDSDAAKLVCAKDLLSQYEAYFAQHNIPFFNSSQLAKQQAEKTDLHEQQAEQKHAEAEFGAENFQSPTLQEIEAVVLKAKKDAYGYYTLTLDNDQVWKLTESSVRFKKGDSIRVFRGTMGAFYLVKKGSSRKARVKRMQ